MTTSRASSSGADSALRDVLHRVWGFSDFRPLQREAMHAILDRRDSVVVLPTGGGKSLCFQAPALIDGPPQGAAIAGPAEARHYVRRESRTGVVSGFSRTIDQRGRLEAQRLPPAGRQHDEAVAAIEDGVHRLALQRTEIGEAPHAVEHVAQDVGHRLPHPAKGAILIAPR